MDGPPRCISEQKLNCLLEQVGSVQIRNYSTHEFTDADGNNCTIRLTEIRSMDGRLLVRQVVRNDDARTPNVVWELVNSGS